MKLIELKYNTTDRRFFFSVEATNVPAILAGAAPTVTSITTSASPTLA